MRLLPALLCLALLAASASASAFNKAACESVYATWDKLAVVRDKNSWDFKDQAYKLEQAISAKGCPRLSFRFLSKCDEARVHAKTPGLYGYGQPIAAECEMKHRHALPDTRYADPGLKPESQACQDANNGLKSCLDNLDPRRPAVLWNPCQRNVDELTKLKCRGYAIR